MLGSHSQVLTCPEPHLITPLAFLGYHDLVDKAPYDHVNAAEAVKTFVSGLPNRERDYLDALRAYTDTMYGRMLAKSDKRYFLDKTPAYALVLPFLTSLYPAAHYVVLTRHPLAVMSSYANSFFDGDWHAANEFNPIVNRYVPAIAQLLREPVRHVLHVRYEQLVREPETELGRVFGFLTLPDEPSAIDYGERFVSGGPPGMGDPISVAQQRRPVESSLNKWVAELIDDSAKLTLASQIVHRLHDEDLRLWGFDKAQLMAPLEQARREGDVAAFKKPDTNNYVLQRRIMLALKKDIRHRPHGRLLERVRYYCNVLLRE